MISENLLIFRSRLAVLLKGTQDEKVQEFVRVIDVKSNKNADKRQTMRVIIKIESSDDRKICSFLVKPYTIACIHIYCI